MSLYNSLFNLAEKMRALAIAFVLSEKTTWFFLGMAFEGLGIGLQFQFGWPAYPILDFVVGAIIGMFLMWYQQRERQEEDEDEDK